MADTTRQRMSKAIADSEGLVKCRRCGSYKPQESFVKGDRVLLSCLDCRRKYMDKKSQGEMKCGVPKMCNVCQRLFPLNMYVNSEGKICMSCPDCRIAYIQSQIPDTPVETQKEE